MKLVAKTQEGKSLIGRMLFLGGFGYVARILVALFLFIAIVVCIAIPLTNGERPEFGRAVGWLIFSGIAWIFKKACLNVIKDTTKAIQKDKVNFEEK